jgi:hypothetical protein
MSRVVISGTRNQNELDLVVVWRVVLLACARNHGPEISHRAVILLTVPLALLGGIASASRGLHQQVAYIGGESRVGGELHG